MTTVRGQRVGAKGQVVIPKELRDELDIHPGDQMIFWAEDGHVAGELMRESKTPLLGRFASHGLLSELQLERRSERQREGKQ